MSYRYSPCELCQTPIAYGRMAKHLPGCQARTQEEREHYKDKMDTKRAHYNKLNRFKKDRETRAYELATALKIAQRILDLPDEEKEIFLELLEVE